MKKLFQILIPALLLPALAFSQTKDRDVTASAGDFSTAPSIQLSWTVGEVAVNSGQSGNLIVTEGFQQADEDPTDAPAPSEFAGEITVFPNPVEDVLNFEIRSRDPLKLRAEVYDLQGQRVLEIPGFRVLSEHRGQVDFTKLPAGKWFLRFSTSGHVPVKTFVVTKLD